MKCSITIWALFGATLLNEISTSEIHEKNPRYSSKPQSSPLASRKTEFCQKCQGEIRKVAACKNLCDLCPTDNCENPKNQTTDDKNVPGNDKNDANALEEKHEKNKKRDFYIGDDEYE